MCDLYVCMYRVYCAWQGRQELEEIESSIDSQLIERMSHQYEYKEKHRPKDPSVKPVTEWVSM